jgi:CMP/dCMP kinase
LSLPNTIAVDGPAGSGKSSVSFAVAQRIGYLFVDTGAFYRAITFLALEQHLDVRDPLAVGRLAREANLDMTPDLGEDNRQYTLLANGRDITCAIHSPEVDENVSFVAAHPPVREALLDVQRKVARRGKAIIAGRDIGTVVLPDAELKVYIDASLEKRAERRRKQRQENHESADLDSIRKNLSDRDKLDAGRDTAPLLCAPDAILLDTSELNLEQSIEALYQIVVNYH